MKSFLLVFLAAALLTIWNYYTNANVSAKDSRPAPEFPSQEAGRWINSKPLKMTGNDETGLRGKVVLLNVWTFM
ncbi:hypothetical protein L0337_26470 [candidate division KSB1 bacterium]|nr:hypothetical protein [candidate division KSB1 bacterium]